MSRASVAGKAVFAVAAIAGLLACGTEPRSTVSPDSALAAELGFIRGPRVARAMVEARLGAPEFSYESGRIVSYTLLDDKGRLSQTRGFSCYALMIEYDRDGVIAHHALLRHASPRCQAK